MELVHTLAALGPLCAGGTCLSIGMFDGVHLGHQMLLGRIVTEARARGLKAVALTFPGHPLALLAPPYAPPLLSEPEEKLELLAQCGVDISALLEFTPEFAATPAPEFIRGVITEVCGARLIVCGADFRFGAQGQGDVELLRAQGADFNFGVEVCEAVYVEGQPVRSSRVRQLIGEGRVGDAARLLGRPYALRGKVVQGDQRGRTIGYPTANLEIGPAKLAPQHGVYAVRVRGEGSGLGGAAYGAMLNIGIRPTFGLQQRTIEAHLFDFTGDLYGVALRVEFVAKIRDEMKFSGVPALIEQLRRDEMVCRGILR